MTRRSAFTISLFLSLLAFGSSSANVFAKDHWTSVRSKNFLFVSNASEKDIREVGTRLEQFREVFSRLFTNLNINSPIPTTVVVFKNHESYRPFQLNARNAGYFQPGSDVNYIALKLIKDPGTEQDPYTIIFHEYTHLLLRTTTGNVPLWFNEGMAEYYSTFSVTDDRKVVMGKPISSHVYLLRERKMLPLRALFQVDSKSPYYNEEEKQSIFYAESWALMHYLMLGKNGQRMPQLGNFIDLMAGSVPIEDAFRQAFSTTFENMEQELRAYIKRDRYPFVSGSFTNKVIYDSTMRSTPITEAEAQAYLGDLLLKSNRADCETYLQKALALDPDQPMANASLGLLRVRQGKHEEARQRLERALAASSQNYLIHYYYAFALSREGIRDADTVMGFAPEIAAKMRAELKRAIELRPDFLESYSLLAFVNLVTETDVDETVEMMKRILARSPERDDFVFMLAQLYLRNEDFGAARKLIDRLSKSSDLGLRQRADGLRNQLAWLDKQPARTTTGQADSSSLSATRAGRNINGQAIVYDVDPEAVLRESLRKPATGETQAQATLVRIDCDNRGITFVVKIGDRFRRLSTDSFSHMSLTTFTAAAGGEITCGPRKPEDNIVVAYVPTTDTRSKVDGVVKSVEFVPQDFKLKP
jgi:tetratricopeptide (TPR) repeat protein